MQHFTGSFHTIKYELPREVGDVPFMQRVEYFLQHCEDAAIPFARLCDVVQNLDENKRYVIGFGVGHVWVHRNGQFVKNYQHHPQNERFAIIVSNEIFFNNVTHTNEDNNTCQ